ncbi:MAG: ABC transporter permease [Candidatus Hydrothermarchaeales archaeon]
MRLKDTFGFAVNNLINRGMRSWLTVLGVVVGITAVVAIVSIGAGLQASVSEQISAWGTNTITVTPGYSRASARGGFGSHRASSSLSSTEGNLTSNDEKAIETIPEVLYVNGVISGRGGVSFMNEASQVSIQGVRPEVWSEMVSARLAEGRYLTQGDSFSAVVGDSIAKGLFTQSLNLNGRITIEGRSFKIVGVLEPSVMGSEDYQIFIPRSTAVDVLEDAEEDQFTSIVVEVDDAANVTMVADEIESKLLVSHRILVDKKDFSIRTPVAIQSRMAEVTRTMTVFLGGIAAVSLLVGAIGIANTMYMSVMERTRQIGTLKALGSTNGEVMLLFLFEAGLMGFVGGVLGILFGFIISGLISLVGFRLFMGRSASTVIPPYLVVFALVFSLVIGMVAGVFPARHAAGLQPVEALRYE